MVTCAFCGKPLGRLIYWVGMHLICEECIPSLVPELVDIIPDEEEDSYYDEY